MTSLFTGRHQSLALCFILLASVLFSSSLLAVDCTSANIALSTQAEVDNFQTTYGGGGTCDTVTGSLTITGADISDLAGLADLASVGGTLVIFSNAGLVNVNGLSALTSVGGDLIIQGDAALTNLDGLSAVASVGGELRIQINATLANLDGLSAVASVGGDLNISFNNALANLDGVSALTTVGGDLIIRSNAALTNLDGLSALASLSGDLDIFQNDALTNVNGLSVLTSVGQDFFIIANDILANVNGLSALTSVGGNFNISTNDALANVNGLSALAGVGGGLFIINNAVLANLDGLSTVASVGGLNINTNDILANLDGLSALTSVGGVLEISDNAALTNLDGLSALTSVGGLLIDNNDALVNVNGLSALASVGGNLTIQNNAALTNLDGLSALTSVGVDVIIQSNSQLALCSGLTALFDDVDDGVPGPGPGVAGIPDVGGDVTMSENLPGCDSVAQVLGEPATFLVTKTFSDGNTAEVEVTRTCNGGLPLQQMALISEGHPVGFILTNISQGESTCEITETSAPGDGYTASYDNGSTISATACTYTGVVSEAYTCAITNTADPASYTVTKLWIVPNAGNDEADYDVDVTITCASEILMVDGVPPAQAGNLVVVSLGDGDSSTVKVDTESGDSECSATEDVLQSGVEAEASAGCTGAVLSAGGSANCTFTNTLFFEGIPTLNPYGLAIVALLMLGVGLVGFRRFA